MLFRRRTAAQSNLASSQRGNLSIWYGKIRMLDAEGYSHEIIATYEMWLEFRRLPSGAMTNMPM